jgi:curved DNA-binding protein
MEYQDYYKVLGVSKGATDKEIKSAYRQLARKLHPDVNPGDKQAEERFKAINEAYEVLSDPSKRQKYDQLGSDWFRWQQSGGNATDFDWTRWAGGQPGAGTRYTSFEDLSDLFGGGQAGGFSDFFGQVFGGMGGRGRPRQRVRVEEFDRFPQRGRDRTQEVEVSLQEAYQGTTRLLNKDGRQLRIKIPPGAKTGTKVRFTGEGNPGRLGGEAGDLYLQVKVRDDPRFERRGDDLHGSVEVDVYTALLGGKSAVSTFEGTLMLTIKPGTQNGQVFRLRDKGMPKLRQTDQHGDLYVKVDVRLPEQLTPRQRELLQEMRQAGE